MHTTRLISPAEVPLMAPAAKQFFEEFGLSGTFNKISFTVGWTSLVRHGGGFVIACFNESGGIDGAIGMAMNVDIATGDKICVEMFYYVTPSLRGHGLRLLGLAEEEAVRHRCKRIWMIHLENERAEGMKKIYERKGFALKEHLYMKELQ